MRKLISQFYFSGYILNTELPGILNLATIVLYPSLRESFGIPILESMACGTPVIAFNVGGMPDLIKNDINGFLAERIDEKSLQKSLEKAIDTKFCGLLIHQNSKKLRDYDVIAGEYCDLYQHVLG